MTDKMGEISQQLFIGRIADILATLPPCLDDERLAPDSKLTEKRRQSLLAGRSLLKFALVHNGLLEPLAQLPAISYTKLHKPYFNDLPVHFNLSHSHGWMVLALGSQPQGVDLEAIDPKRRLSERLIKRVLTGVEYTFFQHLEHSEQLEKEQLEKELLGQGWHLEQNHLGQKHLEQITLASGAVELNVSDVVTGTAQDAPQGWVQKDEVKFSSKLNQSQSDDINTNVCVPAKLGKSSFVVECQGHSSISSISRTNNIGHSSNSSTGGDSKSCKSINIHRPNQDLPERLKAEHSLDSLKLPLQAGLNQTDEDSLAPSEMNKTSFQVSLPGAGAVMGPQVSAAGREFFFLQWTLKECLLKLQGSSIFDLDSLVIDPQTRRVEVPQVPHFNPWFSRTLSFRLHNPEDESAFWLTVGVYDDWAGTIWRLTPVSKQNQAISQAPQAQAEAQLKAQATAQSSQEPSQVQAGQLPETQVRDVQARGLEAEERTKVVQRACGMPLNAQPATATKPQGLLEPEKRASLHNLQNLAQNLDHTGFLGVKALENKHSQALSLKSDLEKHYFVCKNPDFIWKFMIQDASVSYELVTQT